MRGDQLGRQWRTIRAIEASPNGLTVTEIAQREETGIRTIYRDLEALQAAGFSLSTERDKRANRWAFRETSKSRPFPPFTLTEPGSLYSYRDLIPSSIHSSVNGLEVGPVSPYRGSE
jgi:predicted DNA-binding transcriptional regulator YafY